MPARQQPISALDVANYLIDLAGRERRFLDPMTLQKMLYYAQCWHLAERGEPLFDDDIEAWTWGPVVRTVWKAYSGKRPIVPDNPFYDELSTEQRAIVDSVWLSYRHLSAAQLSRKTHKEAPWLRARRGLRAGQRSDRSLDRDLMRKSALAAVAEKSDWFRENWNAIAAATGG